MDLGKIARGIVGLLSAAVDKGNEIKTEKEIQDAPGRNRKQKEANAARMRKSAGFQHSTKNGWEKK